MKIIKKKIFFNLSTSRVSAALVFFDENKNKIILENFLEEKIKVFETEKEFNEAIVKAFDKISIDLIAKANIFNSEYILEDIVIFLTQPWIDYEIENLSDEKIEEFVLDENYLENFFQRKNFNENKRIIETKIFNLKLNEYSVDNIDIRNKKVKKIKGNFLDIFIFQEAEKVLREILNLHFPLLKVKFRAFLPIFLDFIIEIYRPNYDFYFLDYSNEIIELGRIQNKKIHSIILFPFGEKKIIERISKKQKIDLKTAESQLDLFLNDLLEDEKNKKITKIFNDFRKDFEKEFLKIYEKKDFSNPIFIVNNNFRFRKILLKLDLFENIFWVDEKILNNFFDLERDFQDNFMKLEAWGIF